MFPYRSLTILGEYYRSDSPRDGSWWERRAYSCPKKGYGRLARLPPLPLITALLNNTAFNTARPSIETISDRKALQSMMRWKDTSAALAVPLQGRYLGRSADLKAQNKENLFYTHLDLSHSLDYE
ncbi:hypothetical protein EVAR_60641_1 [Eumeta japonica]|uniref:Uncharacterized protein n=1 Tax=Eumeta variegata TaxID=151549 RepID=A0A4C1ZQ83_EUMVA|nr:hypothetical protein EVAR_60641_1 [Eumeta japonica]